MKGNITTKMDDWHRADIVAALKKKGWSLRGLSAANNYSPTVLSGVLNSPWPKGEKIIADAIGVAADQIWPSRYKNGVSNRRPGRRRKVA